MKKNNKKVIKIRINCDCASYYDTRTRLPRNTLDLAIKCKLCKKRLGIMQYKIID